jgi:fructoselysine 6-phosphate deglycase
MATAVNKERIIRGLEPSAKAALAAAKLGQQLAPKIDRVYLVGCGAPNRVMLGLQYWLEHYSPSIEVRRYFPAEFTTLNPPRLDERSLVLLGSKSGTTPETVQAAEFLKGKPCTVIGVTQTAELPLAKAVQHPFLMGETEESHYGMFIVMQALIGGLMAAKDRWPLQDKLMASLAALPRAIAETAEANEHRATEEARLYKDDRILYHVAAGPCFASAYVFGVCVLMEMQWMHSYPIEAAEFFHGPFEIVDQNMPFVLLVGEDPSRPLMERVERFCRKYTERLMTYDSRDFAMPGIDPAIRPIVAPYILEAALGRLAARLAVWHNHPLSTRRYMWKTEY